MKRLFLYILAIIAFTNIVKAETGTASFDFSINSWGLPACPGLSEISSYNISAETKLQDNGVTITLAPSPYKISSKYVGNWRSDINALYYNTYSHFVIKTNDAESVISKIDITFADGQNGGRGYFYDTWQTNKVNLNNKYTLTGDYGSLDLTCENYSEIHWLCNQNDGAKLQIKKIVVSYNSVTSAIDNVSNSNIVTTFKGGIKINGKYTNISVYNISGSMISKNQNEINCPAGIYIVKIDGKAIKVIVK